MVKIKQLSIIKLVPLILLGATFLLATPFYGRASASVDPGCYASSATVGSSDEVTRSITKTTCPDSEQSKVDDQQLCFVTSVSSGGQSAFVETDCETVSLTSDTSSGGEDASIKVDLDGEGVELDGEHYCGKGDKQVRISFDIGCLGNSYTGPEYNPVLDMLFALLRFVSTGVGIIVTGSIVWAGIQYSTSRGNPQGTEAALKRVSNAVIALLIYIFAFAILNFLVPGGLFI